MLDNSDRIDAFVRRCRGYIAAEQPFLAYIHINTFCQRCGSGFTRLNTAGVDRRTMRTVRPMGSTDRQKLAASLKRSCRGPGGRYAVIEYDPDRGFRQLMNGGIKLDL